MNQYGIKEELLNNAANTMQAPPITSEIEPENAPKPNNEVIPSVSNNYYQFPKLEQISKPTSEFSAAETTPNTPIDATALSDTPMRTYDEVSNNSINKIEKLENDDCYIDTYWPTTKLFCFDCDYGCVETKRIRGSCKVFWVMLALIFIWLFYGIVIAVYYAVAAALAIALAVIILALYGLAANNNRS